MASTLRLSPEIRVRADQYAQGLGLSLNALVAVALKDYLDAREGVLRGSGDGGHQVRPGGGVGEQGTGNSVTRFAVTRKARPLSEVEAFNLEVERRKAAKKAAKRARKGR